MADSTPAEEVERILMEALGMVEKVGGGEEGTLGEAVEATQDIPVGVEVDPTILERISIMNAVTMNLGMVR